MTYCIIKGKYLIILYVNIGSVMFTLMLFACFLKIRFFFEYYSAKLHQYLEYNGVFSSITHVL
jgi:membrane-associated phospholipid phosphatase